MKSASKDLGDGNVGQPRAGIVASIMARVRTILRSGLRGIGGARGDRRLQLIETLQLGGKRHLMLVQCDGQSYLVGAGGDSVQSITEVIHRPAVGLTTSAMGASLADLRPDLMLQDSKNEMRLSH
jgi:hypothetical protein